MGGKESTIRKMKCLNCDKITEHTQLSYSDVISSYDERDFTQQPAIGVVYDYVPGISAMVGKGYACVSCSRIRMHGGMLSERWNNKNVFYL